MKRLLLDTNVILDLLLQRDEHEAAAIQVWNAISCGEATGFVAAHAVTTIQYFLRKAISAEGSQIALRDMLTVLSVAVVSHDTLTQALDYKWHDFEDAVTAACAMQSQCDLLVTRDPRGFRRAPCRVVSPRQAVTLLGELR